MIREWYLKYWIKRYCNEDPSLIENYNEAIKDNNQNWQCHHKLEIELNKTINELKEMGLYWNRPANELIFLTRSEHLKLHRKYYNPVVNSGGMKGKKHSNESKQKIGQSVRETCLRRRLHSNALF